MDFLEADLCALLESKKQQICNISDSYNLFQENFRNNIDIFSKFLESKITEQRICASLEKRIEENNVAIEDSNMNIRNHSNSMEQIQNQISIIEDELLSKSKEMLATEKQYKALEFINGKSKEVYEHLKKRNNIYDEYLNCNLLSEFQDEYKFVFLQNGSAVGWIKFRYDENKNHWKVMECDPENILSPPILEKFDESQDTQGLLYYFKKSIS